MPEVGIAEIFDEPDRLAGGLHFRSQLFVDAGELVKAEDRLLDGKPFELFLEGEIRQLVVADHDLGGDVEVGYLVGLCNKGGGPGGPGIGFDHKDIAVLDGELNIN